MTTDFANPAKTIPVSATVVLALPGGKVLTGGTTGDFALARYNANGTLDTTFGGGDGRVTTDFGGGEYLAGLAMLPGGKIFAVGGSNNHQASAQYNADGTLDTAFGLGGKELYGGLVYLYTLTGVAVGPEGDVHTVGWTGDDDGFYHDALLDGREFTLDHSEEYTHEEATSIAIGPDGRIVVGGSSEMFGAFIARFNPDLTLDPTFGAGGADGDGFISGAAAGLGAGVSGLISLPDGKILAGGQNGVVKFNANGSVDKTFGGGDGRGGRGLQRRRARPRFVRADRRRQPRHGLRRAAAPLRRLDRHELRRRRGRQGDHRPGRQRLRGVGGDRVGRKDRRGRVVRGRQLSPPRPTRAAWPSRGTRAARRRRT